MPRFSGKWILFAVGLTYMGLVFYLHTNFGGFMFGKNQMEEPQPPIYEPDHKQAVPQEDVKIAVQPKLEDKAKDHSKKSRKKLPVHWENVTFVSQCDNKRYTDSFFISIVDHTYVYSAYLDDRKPGTKFVRLMILTDGRKPSLWCHFKSRGHRYAVPSQDLKGNKFGYYELCENHGMSFGGYVSSCAIPDEIASTHLPCKVIVANSETLQSRQGVVLPLRTIGSPKHSFGMCIPALFGSPSIDMMTEFFEVSRRLGAEKINLYVAANISPDLKILLEHYHDQGLLNIIPWHLPPGAESSWNYAQILNINDCLFRSMSLAKYVAFNDIDEYIVPRFLTSDGKGAQWSHLVQKLWKPKETCGVCFHSVFFDPTRGRGSQGSGLRIRVNQERSLVESTVRTKCLVEPLRIFEMGIHHISKPNEEFYTNTKIGGNVAVLQHYRVCLSDFGMRCDQFVHDTTIERYSVGLEDVVTAVKSKLALQ